MMIRFNLSTVWTVLYYFNIISNFSAHYLTVSAFNTPSTYIRINTRTLPFIDDSSSCHSSIVCHQKNSIRKLNTLRLASVPSEKNNGISSNDVESEEEKHMMSTHHTHNPMKIYMEYLTRLWKETSTTARQAIAKNRAKDSIRKVQQIFSSQEYLNEAGGAGGESTVDAVEARGMVLNSCRAMLKVLDKNMKGKMTLNSNGDVKSMETTNQNEDLGVIDSHVNGSQTHQNNLAASVATAEIATEESTSSPSVAVAQAVKPEETTLSSDENNSVTLKEDEGTQGSSSVVPDKKKKSRSVMFGAAMGAVVACWVFSGNYIFTGLFTLMTILGQLEYYRMVMNTGSYPARRISVVGASAMFITALFAPDLHQVVLPVFAMLSMVWFLTMKREISTISDIATTFTGMFYLGYIPSFWVRIRASGRLVPESTQATTRLAEFLKPFLDRIVQGGQKLPDFVPKTIHLPITEGSVFIFWTWISIAFSDVGAYFAGRKFGKTKLGQVCPAAGETSPNKTVEGVIGGCIFAALFSTFGAWVMKWPLWFLVGPLHGISLGLLGLVGDLTASMLKRDAGLKDFGDLIPEHGGIMDRVDSFVFTAPYSWLVSCYLIPFLRRITGSGVMP